MFSLLKMKCEAIALVLLLLVLGEVGQAQDEAYLSRDDFPPYFLFGAGTSAYQVEGAVAEGGRSPSIWDNFTHAGKAMDKSNGDLAANQYHKYKEDVKLMADTGLDVYRFSISWSRLLPKGRGKINEEGLKYYNNLINELLSHGIQPHVTLHHVDHPQILEDEYRGWLSLKMVEDFTAFADTCFREFGDRVKYWTTLNEPNVFSVGAYDAGILPPARCSYPFGFCPVGNSPVEPYIVGYHALLAHASIYKLYQKKYEAKQNGKIGLNLYTFWCEPFSNSTADVAATRRVLDFYIGWMLNPLVHGDYPEIMKKNAGPRIPSFTKSQSMQLKGSFDFIGVNHYSTIYVKDSSNDSKIAVREFNLDILAKLTLTKDEEPGGGSVVPGISALPNTPWGLRRLLLYLKDSYGNPPVYVQENGFGMPFNETLNDTARLDYIKGYINATLSAIRDGSNARGYIVWSFLDVFELLTGYLTRFGLYHVDFSSNNFTREPKLSARWYANFLKTEKNGLVLRKSRYANIE